MTWRSLIFFSVRGTRLRPATDAFTPALARRLKPPLQAEACSTFIVVLVLFAGAGRAATVSGRVELRDSKDAQVRKKMDYSGVVVWLEPASGTMPEPPALSARMIQKDKTFAPHVLAVRTGTTVDFPNFDPIFHNAFSNYDGKTFDIGLYPPGSTRSVRFNRPGVVRVFCNIHASMSAVIVVVNTPYFATTKKDGGFEVPAVPAGEYRAHVFHERATRATLDALERRVSIGDGAVTLAPLAVSETGYLPIPHTDKFGHAYHNAPDDDGAYPAVRQ
jgi:plastocyanin